MKTLNTNVVKMLAWAVLLSVALAMGAAVTNAEASFLYKGSEKSVINR